MANSGIQFDILCPDVKILKLQGDDSLSNYQAISVDLEYFFDSKSKEERETDEKVIELIEARLLEFVAEVYYKQLNMDSHTEPLGNAISVFQQELEMNKQKKTRITLSPNSFEDDDDWLGLVNSGG